MRLRHSRLRGVLLLGLFTLFAVATGVVLVVSVGSIGLTEAAPVVKYWMDSPDSIKNTQVNQHTVIYDKNGNQFAEIWTEDREEVSSLDDIADPMQNAVVAAEDKNFYEHGPIDLVSTVRSFVSGSGGGSGITQQLIKNLSYYDNSATEQEKQDAVAVSLSRKIRELKMSINYENTHSKDEILLQYLNTVAMGSPNVYGVETAAETIFNKHAKDLTIGEAAALAGSINNPSLYNLTQLDDEDVAARVKERQTYVLDRMLADGYITQEQHDEAVDAPITTDVQWKAGSCGSSSYPFYCQLVVEYLLDDPELGSTAEERLRTFNAGGLEITTTMDPELMDKLDEQLKADWGVTNPKVQSTAVVAPGGAILAIGANRNWGTDTDAGETQVVLANRGTQTGSTYKMITLAAALADGWTEAQLNTIYGACPWNKAGFDVPSGGITNSVSCALQGGALGYQKATAYSANTWFVELESQIGVNKVKEFSEEVGLTVPDDINERSASFTLGVTDNSPIQMAAAYATFNNKGVYCPATPISSMKRTDGKPINDDDDYDPSVHDCKAVMSPYAASVVLKAQNANINGNISGRFGEQAAISGHTTVGKSGTTNDYANLSWTQTAAQFTVFSNAYDPRGNFAYPMTSFTWRGHWTTPTSNPSMITTRDFIASALAGQPDVALDLNNTQTTLEKVVSNAKNMVTVPSVVGMTPEQALQALKENGINGAILKQTGSDDEVKNNASYSGATVIKQSIAAGAKIAEGSSKTVELTISGGGDETGNTDTTGSQ